MITSTKKKSESILFSAFLKLTIFLLLSVLATVILSAILTFLKIV